ncbi:MAG: tetratricopeptide repeat protein [Deltaproteobacteria bacterium]|nr:tetratricopeptide repeat protein [Deltaproteobacteria bacterium]
MKIKYYFLISCFFTLFFNTQPPLCAKTPAIQKPSATAAAEKQDRDLIRKLLKDGFYDFALMESNEFFHKYPKSGFTEEITFVTGQLHQTKGETDQALKAFSRLINEFPDSIWLEETLFLTALIHLDKKQWQKAQDYFNQLKSKFPESKFNDQSAFFLGKADFYQKRFNLASLHFQRAKNQNNLSENRSLEIRLFLAWIDFFQGELKKAEKQFRELLKSKLDMESKSQIAFQLGLKSFENKNYKTALHWFEQLKKKWPHENYREQSLFYAAESYFSLYQKAPASLKVYELSKAVRYFQENLLLKKPKKETLSRYHRGLLLIALKKNEEAEVDFSWLQETKPEYARNIDLTLLRADYFLSSGKEEKANQVYLKALNHQSDPKIKSELLVYASRGLFKANQCDRLLDLTDTLNFVPDQKWLPELGYYRGKCFFSAKKWEKTQRALNQIPLESEFFKFIINDLLISYQNTRDFKDGLRFIERAAKSPEAKKSLIFFLVKAEFQFELGLFPQTLNTLKEIQKSFPGTSKDPDILIRIAKTYDQLSSKEDPTQKMASGEPDTYQKQAMAHYELAFKLLPDEEIQRRLDILNLLIKRGDRQKDYPRILAYLSEYVEIEKSVSKRDETRLKMARILLYKTKEQSKAKEILSALNQRDSDEETYAIASSLLAEIAIENNRLDEAIEILMNRSAQTPKSSPWYPKFHYRLAELYQAQEHWEKAVDHYMETYRHSHDKNLKEQANKQAGQIKDYLKQTR